MVDEGICAVRFLLLLAWAVAFSAAGGPGSKPVVAQTQFSLDNLNRRVIELEQAGKYSDAIPLADRYVEAITAQHGPDSVENAVALSQLARLLPPTVWPKRSRPCDVRWPSPKARWDLNIRPWLVPHRSAAVGRSVAPAFQKPGRWRRSRPTLCRHDAG
jgi:hypothetical protein